MAKFYPIRPNISSLMTSGHSRRGFLATTAGAAAAGLAGCLGDDDGITIEETIGHGEYETDVTIEDPDELFAYAVQTGWSNWDAVMEAFEDEYGVSLHDDQRTSGEALTHARANRDDPQYSIFNGGYSFAIEAMQDDLTTDYQPAGWDQVPDALKTDNNHATATRAMTVAVNYRKDIYEERGLDEPESWEDLKHPDIAQDFAVNTPHAAAGLASLMSINHAYGGDLNNVDPVIEYLEDMAEHGAEHRRNLTREFTAGEVSTYVEYDFGGLGVKYNDDDLAEDQVGVMIPQGPDGGEGAMNVPYGFALLNNARQTDLGKLFMDFVLSLDVQEMFFDGFVRPIRADELDAPEEFPDQSQYDAAEFALDQVDYVEAQEDLIDELVDRSPMPGAEG